MSDTPETKTDTSAMRKQIAGYVADIGLYNRLIEMCDEVEMLRHENDQWKVRCIEYVADYGVHLRALKQIRARTRAAWTKELIDGVLEEDDVTNP